MPRDGSGRYSLPTNSWYPPENGQDALPKDFQSLVEDIATALSQSFSADGQTPVQNNLNMNGYRMTGLGAPLASSDAINRAFLSRGIDVTLAAVIDLPSRGSFFDVIGTGTLEDIRGSFQGRQVWLRFGADVTIKDGNNLLMPSSRDYETQGTTVGHFIEIEQDVWLCSQIGTPPVVGREPWQVPTNQIVGDQFTGLMGYFDMSTAPDGWLECDGSEVSKTIYANLYAKIGDRHGVASDNTKFKLPNATDKNRYLRAAGGALNVGDGQDDQIKKHKHGATSDGAGGHAHTRGTMDITGSFDAQGYSGSTGLVSSKGAFRTTSRGLVDKEFSDSSNYERGRDFVASRTWSGSTSQAPNHDHKINIDETGGDETRPYSLVGLLCIKY